MDKQEKRFFDAAMEYWKSIKAHNGYAESNLQELRDISVELDDAYNALNRIKVISSELDIIYFKVKRMIDVSKEYGQPDRDTRMSELSDSVYLALEVIKRELEAWCNTAQ